MPVVLGSMSVGVNGGTAPYSFIWTSSTKDSLITASSLIAGNYTVVVDDRKGCNTDASGTISEPPIVITAASADETICRNSQAIISANASGGSGGYFWLWNQGLPSGQQHTVAPVVTTTYLVAAFDQNGCPGKIEPIKIKVLTLDPEDVVVDGTKIICPGATGTVYANVSNPSTGTLQYSWVPNIGNGPGAYHVTPTSAPANYECTVTNQCGVSITKSVSIDFLPPPVVNLTASAFDGCEEFIIDFKDVSVNSSDQIGSWFWNFGDGNSSTAANPTHTYQNAGQYNVSLTATTNGGCSVSSASTHNTVNVYPKPKALFTYNPNPVYTLEPANFSNQSSGAISYSWNFGDGNHSNAVNPKHVYRSAETFNVSLTATSDLGCKDTYELELLATGKLLVPNVFTPNPNGPNGGRYDKQSFDNSIFFPFADGVEVFSMQIFNRWGELIFETKDIKIGWDGYYRNQLCKQDVYVWKIAALFNDDRLINQVGDITLLR